MVPRIAHAQFDPLASGSLSGFPDCLTRLDGCGVEREELVKWRPKGIYINQPTMYDNWPAKHVPKTYLPTTNLQPVHGRNT